MRDEQLSSTSCHRSFVFLIAFRIPKVGEVARHWAGAAPSGGSRGLGTRRDSHHRVWEFPSGFGVPRRQGGQGPPGSSPGACVFLLYSAPPAGQHVLDSRVDRRGKPRPPQEEAGCGADVSHGTPGKLRLASEDPVPAPGVGGQGRPLPYIPKRAVGREQSGSHPGTRRATGPKIKGRVTSHSHIGKRHPLGRDEPPLSCCLPCSGLRRSPIFFFFSFCINIEILTLYEALI